MSKEVNPASGCTGPSSCSHVSTTVLLVIVDQWRRLALENRKTTPNSSRSVGMEDCAGELEQIVIDHANAQGHGAAVPAGTVVRRCRHVDDVPYTAMAAGSPTTWTPEPCRKPAMVGRDYCRSHAWLHGAPTGYAPGDCSDFQPDDGEPVCNVCGGPLSVNFRKGVAVCYCPDHGDQNSIVVSPSNNKNVIARTQ